MKITLDGEYKLEVDASSSSIIYVSGSDGGGTITLGYMDDNGFVPLTDGTLQVGEQYEVNHGAGMYLFVKLTGSTGASITVITKGMKQ